MAAAGVGVAEAGTGGVGVVIVDVVVPLETASFRPRAKVSYVVGESLERLRGREEEHLIKGVPNLPGREAGLLANAEGSSAISWVSQSWSSSWCRASLGRALSFGVAVEESWESLSETSFWMALTTSLTRSAKERLRFPFKEGCAMERGGCGWSGRGLNADDISHG